MAPVRTYPSWNKRTSDEEPQREPFRKYFFICEGINTEVWYFRKLIDMRKQLGIHPLIALRLMERTDEDEGRSNPKALITFAEKQKKVQANDFDIAHDKMIIVFDADIYKYKANEYRELIKTGQKNNVLAVTNPSFELFLLLHFDNSYENDIKPNAVSILGNQKVGKRRYITALFTDKCGMNPKENPSIGELVKDIDIAINQEKMMNQNIDNAIGQLTCNIGKIIDNIRNDINQLNLE